MKVLQINSVCGYGSTGSIATDIYKILEKQGHECLIAYGRGNSPKGINSIKIGTNFDNYMHVAQTRLSDKHGFASIRATKELINTVKEYNPDVIHLHNIHGYYINIELLFNYLKEANKPVVWTLHDCWAFTGHCAYFDYAGCDKWKIGCNDCPEKKSYPASILLDNSKCNYQNKKIIFTGVKNLMIVTPSKWLSGLVKQSYLNEYPVEVINNGIDLDVFKPTQGNFRERYNLKNKFIILGVANVWDRRKGFKYFIELSEKINKDEVIVLVGLTEKQKKELPKNIIGITRTNSVKEIVEIYTAADVFVNPTLEDNFPTTNIEALACGTPVITFDTGGSVESIDENCGIIISKKDLDNSPNLLQEAFKNIKTKDIKKCRERAQIMFNKNIIFNKYIMLYNKLVM